MGWQVYVGSCKGAELVFSHAGKKNILVPVKVGDRMRVSMLDDTSRPVVREPEYEGSDNDIFQVVEDMPQFPGGSVQRYVAQHIKYPKEAGGEEYSGKSICSICYFEDRKSY